MHYIYFVITFALFTTSKQQGYGFFWHLADAHFDPDYTTSGNPDKMCHSDNGSFTPAQQFGDYLCDSPYLLIQNAVAFMKSQYPNPDFIIWTGDDPPHIPVSALSEDKVLNSIQNITTLLKSNFPGVQVYPALGNHDTYPKGQFVEGPNYMYNMTANIWSDWLPQDALATFRKGGYYTLPIKQGLRIISLNTNLYYTQNQLSEKIRDPAGQVQWLIEILTSAKKRHRTSIYNISRSARNI